MRLLKFEKEGCIPCENVSNYLESKNIVYEKINAFDNPELSIEFKIRTVPTLVLLKDGNEVKRVVGYDEEKIDELIKEI